MALWRSRCWGGRGRGPGSAKQPALLRRREGSTEAGETGPRKADHSRSRSWSGSAPAEAGEAVPGERGQVTMLPQFRTVSLTLSELPDKKQSSRTTGQLVTTSDRLERSRSRTTESLRKRSGMPGRHEPCWRQEKTVSATTQRGTRGLEDQRDRSARDPGVGPTPVPPRRLRPFSSLGQALVPLDLEHRFPYSPSRSSAPTCTLLCRLRHLLPRRSHPCLSWPSWLTC